MHIYPANGTRFTHTHSTRTGTKYSHTYPEYCTGYRHKHTHSHPAKGTEYTHKHTHTFCKRHRIHAHKHTSHKRHRIHTPTHILQKAQNTHTHTHTLPMAQNSNTHTILELWVLGVSYSSTYDCRASNNGISDTVSKTEKKMLLRDVYLDPQHDWLCWRCRRFHDLSPGGGQVGAGGLPEDRGPLAGGWGSGRLLTQSRLPSAFSPRTRWPWSRCSWAATTPWSCKPSPTGARRASRAPRCPCGSRLRTPPTTVSVHGSFPSLPVFTGQVFLPACVWLCPVNQRVRKCYLGVFLTVFIYSACSVSAS